VTRAIAVMTLITVSVTGGAPERRQSLMPAMAAVVATSPITAFAPSFVVEETEAPPPLLTQGLPPQAPVMPVRVATGVCMTDEASCHPPTTPPRQTWRYCEEWHDTAAAIGWPESQGPTLSYVMHRESLCRAGARNRSGATGLMQLLGWSCPPNGCADGWSNLAEAYHLWEQQGWCPWVLRGDPVTGRACG
jgi:hypothetical protein